MPDEPPHPPAHTPAAAGSEFLVSSASRLLKSMERIESCSRLLTDQQIWQRHSENENAVGNLLLHLNGNVRQWILCGVGGQSDHRDRDAEFSARIGPPASELLRRLRATVEEAVTVIRKVPPERLTDRITPQDYEGTVLGAIYHVVEHFAGHTYQVIFLTKFFTGNDLGFYAYLSGNRKGQGRKQP